MIIKIDEIFVKFMTIVQRNDPLKIREVVIKSSTRLIVNLLTFYLKTIELLNEFHVLDDVVFVF